MRTTDEILTLEEAELFISACGDREQTLLCTAILRVLPVRLAEKAADEAGYDLVQQ